MSKTLSLVTRVVAILGAAGAGAGFYYINELNIKPAMQATNWLSSDTEIKAGPTFLDRVAVQPKVDALLNAKREEIKQHLATIAQREATIVERDNTIKEKNAVIEGLEQNKADLTRQRDELTASLQQANSKNTELQNQVEDLNKTIAQKTEEIASMFTKEQFDAEVKKRQDAEDKYQRAVDEYTRLFRWALGQTGFNPPFPKVPGGEKPDVVVPLPKEALPRIPTKIIATDRSKGIVTFSIGSAGSNLLPGQIYDVELDNAVVGRVRITEVLPSYTVVNILPHSDRRLFAKDTIVKLVRSQAPVGAPKADVAAPAAAPAAAAPAAADAGAPPPPPM